MANSKYSEDVIKEVIDLYLDGVNGPELAQRFKIPLPTIYYLLSQRDVARRTSGESEQKVTLEQIVELYDQGWSTSRIAKKFDMNAASVFLRMRRNGIPLRSRKEAIKKFTPKQEKEIVDMYLSGQKAGVVAKKYGCHRTTIHNILKRYHVVFRNDMGAVEKGSAPRYGEAVRDEIILLYEEGLTSAEIAKRLEISAPGVNYLLHACGITVRKSTDYLTKASDEEIRRLYVDERLSIKQVGKKLGYTGGGPISARLKRLGVTIRNTRPHVPRKIPKQHEKHIIDRYRTGESCQEIANTYHCSETTIRKVLIRNNVSRNNSRKGKHVKNYDGTRSGLSRKVRNMCESTAWRQAIFERDNFTCQICGQVGGRLEADHQNPFCHIFAEFLEKARPTVYNVTDLASRFMPFWDIGNGVTLCYNCHNEKSKTVPIP